MVPQLSPAMVSVLVALAIFFSLEQFFPLRKQRRPLAHRLMVNFVMSAITYTAAALVMRPVALAAMGWGERFSFGLLHWLSFPPPLSFIVGFLLMDLSFYYWHRLNHALPVLWRFHNVHHFDPDMDASTGFRFHFAEILISTLFRAGQGIFIGASLETFLTFELVFQVATYFHHSNLRLPLGFERLLNLIIVTPRMHAIHHSQVRDQANSNYSVIFSLWDRINRSFRRGIAEQSITIGVAGYSSDADNSLANALSAPFITQREYWHPV